MLILVLTINHINTTNPAEKVTKLHEVNAVSMSCLIGFGYTESGIRLMRQLERCSAKNYRHACRV